MHPTPYWRPALVFTVLANLTFLGGCMGASYRPVVDPKGADMANYESNLSECQAIAREQSVAGNAVTGGAFGAAAGAALGAVMGAFPGDPGLGAAIGAGYGGAAGVIQGGASGVEGQEQIVRNCMSGRGYNVLK